ncbi:MAG: T9SS type A sorting domain-containing protein [Microscillaceae bacterium]|nr:T9SS type A sorting domain-containing protein [Microscillaceae bacterium]MDW8459914.1 T9SS type A sorting domain-containing protein [Cytophagales bacterium]
MLYFILNFLFDKPLSSVIMYGSYSFLSMRGFWLKCLYVFRGLLLYSSVTFAQINIQITATPQGGAPITNPVDPIFICQGQNVVLQASVTGTVGTPTFQWFFADLLGFSAIVGANSLTYANATQEGEYLLQVRDANHPNGVFSQSIFVCVYTGVPIQVSVVSQNGITNLCSSSPNGITLVAQAQNPPSTGFCGVVPISFVWFKGSLQVGTGATYQVPNNPASAGTYTVRAINPCGFSTASINISVVDSPPTNVSISSQDNTNTLCVGGSLRLNAMAQGSGLSYQWFRNGTAINGATAASFLVNYNAFTSYPENYTVQVSNGCGAVMSNPFQVVLIPTPSNVSIQFSGMPYFCDNVGILLSPSASVTNPTRYEWYRNGTLVETHLFPFLNGITYFATQAGSYMVKVFNKCGSATSQVVNIGNSQSPTFVQIRGEPSLSLGCGQTSLKLIAQTDGTNLRYEWYKDNNLVQNSTNNSLIIHDVGVYKVKVIAELPNHSSCGELTSQAVQVISTNAPPNSSISLSTQNNLTQTCDGQITLIANATGNGLQYEWYRDNNWVFTSHTPTWVATASGSYTVRVRNACGSSNFSNAISLTISQLPQNVHIVSGSPTVGCGQENVLLQAQAIGAVSLFEWFRNNNKVAEGTQLTTNQNGTYTLRATNSCGSVTSAPFVINFTTAPTEAVIVPQSTPTLCGNWNIPLSVQTNGNNLQYIWRKNGIVVSNDPVYSANDVGTYTVQIFNACGNAFSAPFIITSSTSLVEPVILPQGNINLCAGASVTLTASTPVVGASFRWFRNNQLITGANSATLTVNEAGNYTVETSKDNCSVLSQPRQVQVAPAPTVLVTYRGSLTFCKGDSVMVQARSQDLTMQYEWLKDTQVLKTGNTFTAKQAGEYTLKATNSCGIVLTSTFNVSTQEKIIPQIAWQQGQLIVLDSAKTYQWYFNGFPIANANQRTFMPLETGKYQARIINDLGCAGLSEPIDFAGWQVDQNDFVQIMPNPNFGAFSLRVLSKNDVTIQLFNQLGQEITEKYLMPRANSLVSYQQFEFNNLTQGLYFLRVQVGNRIVGKRVLVLK